MDQDEYEIVEMFSENDEEEEESEQDEGNESHDSIISSDKSKKISQNEAKSSKKARESEEVSNGRFSLNDSRIFKVKEKNIELNTSNISVDESTNSSNNLEDSMDLIEDSQWIEFLEEEEEEKKKLECKEKKGINEKKEEIEMDEWTLTQEETELLFSNSSSLSTPVASPSTSSSIHPAVKQKWANKYAAKNNAKEEKKESFYGKGGNNGNSTTPSRWQNRKMPDFKLIPKVNFVVDGFKFRKKEYPIYFLTHFHSDHYGGLGKNFNEGIIYCSEITAKLVIQQLKVDPKYIKSLEMNVNHNIEGVEVTLMDANHCPGAAIMLFKVEDLYYLHCGDFRYDPKMKFYPPLQGIQIEGLYLDNTFCDPKYVFPSQSSAISEVVNVVKKESGKSTLFLVGTYSIGKEKVFLKIAQEFKIKAFVTDEKYQLLSCYLSKEELDKWITTDPSQTNLHVVSMAFLNFKRMWELHQQFKNKYTKVIGFQPTGWAFGKTIQSITKKTSGALELYGVPYSEHSNYNELREFVDFVKPKKVKKIKSHFINLGNKPKTSLLPFLTSGVDMVKSSLSSLFGKSEVKKQMEKMEEKKTILNNILSSTSPQKVRKNLTPSSNELIDPFEDSVPPPLEELLKSTPSSKVEESNESQNSIQSSSGSQIEPIDLDSIDFEEQSQILESIQKKTSTASFRMISNSPKTPLNNAKRKRNGSTQVSKKTKPSPPPLKVGDRNQKSLLSFFVSPK
eukprot:TRINITY_DN4131_c0_g1_i6.p1 TRINITY_DN4131_c0_g1~~TRINITY_DN4131_c0_g1_i6.p1  ORF type:complete len:781 (-),score=370.54 TRINITY_DN4131_c0_g1_i6:7-2205(-)